MTAAANDGLAGRQGRTAGATQEGAAAAARMAIQMDQPSCLEQREFGFLKNGIFKSMASPVCPSYTAFISPINPGGVYKYK